MANQLYQHHWDTNEHSGWSDEEEQDPDLPLGHTSNSPWSNTWTSACFVAIGHFCTVVQLSINFTGIWQSIDNRQPMLMGLFE